MREFSSQPANQKENLSQETILFFQIKQLFQESVRHQQDSFAKPLIISSATITDTQTDQDAFAAIAALVHANQLAQMDPSRADPSRADPSRADPSRADPSLANSRATLLENSAPMARKYAFETEDELRDFITDAVLEALQHHAPQLVRQAMIDALVPADKDKGT